MDILQNMYMKAQTDDINPYCIGLQWTFSNARLKTNVWNDCLKGSTGDKHEKNIVAVVPTIYYPNVVQSVTI